MISKKDKEMFLRTVSAAISGNGISFLPEETDVRALYNLSCAHKVTGVAFYALKDMRTSGNMQKELLSRLYAHSVKAKKMLVLQDYYTDAVCNFCRKNGIKFALLKGAVIKHLYPEAFMRSSCDIDVLVDRERIGEIIEEFCKDGFDYHEEDDGEDVKHAKLAKDGVVLELHRALCAEGTYGGHYDNPFDVFESKDGVEYTLCPEELYVYILVHASQHFMKGVNTLRAVSDLYLINKSYADMNKEKLSELLEITGMTGFSGAIKNIQNVVFTDKNPSGDLETVLDYVLMNPLRADTALAELQKETVSGNSCKTKKLSVAFRRVFPSYELICKRYSGAKRTKLLYPYYFVKRVCDSGRQGRIKEQLDAMGRVSDEEIKTLETVQKYSGLC